MKYRLVNPFDNWHIRIMHNPHGSAEKAAELWLAGSLWGNPIYLCHVVHVYGIWKRKWQCVNVEFRDKRITVMVHK